MNIRDLPEEVRNVVRVECFNESKKGGWYAVNSFIAEDCMPVYRGTGGGTTETDLTDLPTAIGRSIDNIRQRIASAERLIRRFEKAKEALTK